jgi:hypothetical protein
MLRNTTNPFFNQVLAEAEGNHNGDETRGCGKRRLEICYVHVFSRVCMLVGSQMIQERPVVSCSMESGTKYFASHHRRTLQYFVQAIGRIY